MKKILFAILLFLTIFITNSLSYTEDYLGAIWGISPEKVVLFIRFALIFLSSLVFWGIIRICIMAPFWANNILNELKKHTKQLEEIKKTCPPKSCGREDKEPTDIPPVNQSLEKKGREFLE